MRPFRTSAVFGGGALGDCNDFEFLTGCTDNISNSFPIKALHRGYEGNRAGLRVRLVLSTIRYFCTRPSSRLKVTVLPKATVSVDVGSVMT
jgi:hypothetical protein